MIREFIHSVDDRLTLGVMFASGEHASDDAEVVWDEGSLMVVCHRLKRQYNRTRSRVVMRYDKPSFQLHHDALKCRWNPTNSVAVANNFLKVSETSESQSPCLELGD